MRAHDGLRLLLLALMLACSRPAFSQTTAALAQLNGTIEDQGGAVIAKANVSLREMETNRAYATTSNESGFYVLPNVLPGRYELKVSYTGFAPFTQTGVVLTVGQTATINVTLKAAGVSGEVTVTSEAPPIEPSRTEISQVVDRKEIESLPISGRLFTDFALLTPGVATGRTSLQSTFTEFEVTRVSFGGMRDLSNIVTVDGADNINTVTASQRATPSQEAVSEFRVVNNSFGAEYGRALGGIVNIVTKSGSNDLHGSVYEYFMNNALNAKSSLTQPGFDRFQQNQFGATLGGRLQKDKTFFFLNYEGQRRAQSPTYPGLLIANLPAINAVKASYGLSPENLNILTTADVDNGFVKFDHQISEQHHISARYLIQKATNLNMLVGQTLDGGGIGAPSSGRNGLLRDQSVVGSWTWTLNSARVNDVLVQWAQQLWLPRRHRRTQPGHSQRAAVRSQL